MPIFIPDEALVVMLVTMKSAVAFLFGVGVAISLPVEARVIAMVNNGAPGKEKPGVVIERAEPEPTVEAMRVAKVVGIPIGSERVSAVVAD